MPYKCETINLPKSKDRRIKLTPSDKEDILFKYKVIGNCSFNSLAKEYGVSKRTISFIINPKSLEENKKRREERGGSKIYYDKDKNRESMKEHRRYKQELYLKGELE